MDGIGSAGVSPAMFHERRRGSGAPRAHRSSSSGCTGTARAARHGHAGTRPRTRSAVVRRQTLSHCRRPSRCRTPSHCRTPGEVSTTRGRGPGEARYRRHASWGSSPFLPGRCIDPDGGRITGQPAYGGSEVVTQRGHRGTTSCGADDDQVGRRRQEAIFLETPSCSSELSSQAIADDGGPDGPRECERDSRPLGRTERRRDHGEWSTSCAVAVCTKATEGVTSADPVDQAESL